MIDRDSKSYKKAVHLRYNQNAISYGITQIFETTNA